TTAETLDDGTRQEIASCFGVPVLDYYAASEGVPLIQQCEHGSYHLRLESGIFEILNEAGEEVGPGEVGELVVTSFCNFRTILIRYRTGDLAVRAPESSACECGRTLPVIERVLGRQEEAALTRDGRIIGMFAYRVLMPLSGFLLAQIVQQAPDRFTVRVVTKPETSMEDVRREIQASIERVLGHP